MSVCGSRAPKQKKRVRPHSTPYHVPSPTLAFTKKDEGTMKANNSNLLHLHSSPPHKHTISPPLFSFIIIILLLLYLYIHTHINLSSPLPFHLFPPTLPPPLLSLFLSHALSLTTQHTPFLLHDCYLREEMMVNDEWVRTAMTDDTVVADFLLGLKHFVSPKSQAVPFSWGLKQPRSRLRLTAASRCDGGVSTRCSPTTPLSWSGGASPSATADGCEDSGRHHAAARSKATATSGYTGNSASTKRFKRKKTFAELKEEESSLLKERIYLKKEIANINANFEAQKSKNESLKRIKLDFGSKSQNNPSSTSDELQCTLAGQPHQRIVPSGALTHATQDDTHSQPSDCRPTTAESTGESFFLIPDLNMMPSVDGSYTDAPCGMS